MKKGIRFESGTTAITVFDEIKSKCHWMILRRCSFAALVLTPLIISQDTCRIFIRFTMIGREECNRLTNAASGFGIWHSLFFAFFQSCCSAASLSVALFPLILGKSFFCLKGGISQNGRNDEIVKGRKAGLGGKRA